MKQEAARQQSKPSVWAYNFTHRVELYAFFNPIMQIERYGIIFMKKVAVIMGSDSDLPVVEKAFAVLKEYDIPFEAHVMSAHRTPAAVREFVSSARENGFGVIIACAGMAAHLAGVCASYTTLPVIGVPIKGGMLDGLDALLATVQMPTGIPVATVAMNGAANAAHLACEILAVTDEKLAVALENSRRAGEAKIAEKDAALAEKL